MPACPQCGSEVAEGQRFCPNCGARQPEKPQPAAPGATVLLPPSPTDTPTERLGAPAPGSEPPAPPPQAAPAPPTQVTPIPPAGSFGVPPSAPPAAQPVQGKTRWGLILGVIGAFVLLACLVVAGAGYFVFQRVQALGDELTSTIVPALTIEIPTIEIPTIEAPTAVVETGAVLFEDDFASEASTPFNTSSDADSTFTVEDGVYVQTVHTPNYFVWSFARENFADAAIAVDAAVEGPSGGAAAIMFRYVDDLNFYIWRVYGDGSHSLQRYVDDELTELIAREDVAALNGAGVNRLRVEMRGDEISLFANGELIAAISDSALSEGDVALGVSAEDEAEVTARFDNLSVSELP